MSLDRMQSWKDCFTFFNSKFFELINASKNEGHNQELLDEATLQIAVYLASFGMYRNQFFLQSNRRILLPVIKSLFKKLDGHMPGEKLTVDLIKELMLNIQQSLMNSFKNIQRLVETKEIVVSGGLDNLKNECLHATDTAVTKILMGITGCVPACDTNYRLAVTFLNKELCKGNKLPRDITAETVNDVLLFVKANYGFFSPWVGYLGVEGKRHNLVMRVFDLYMWQLGFAENERIKRDKKEKRQLKKTKAKSGNVIKGMDKGFDTERIE